MPLYTAPVGAPSLGNSGYGAAFYIGTAASPFSYNLVAEVKTITKKNFTIPAIDLTNLLSPNATEEMTPGMLKPGTQEITGNFTGDTSQMQFTLLAEAQALAFWKITAPMQKGAKTLTSSGVGFVVDFETGPFEGNKAIDFKLTFQMTGTITETVA